MTTSTKRREMILEAMPRQVAVDLAGERGRWRQDRGRGDILEGTAMLTERWLRVDLDLAIPVPVSTELLWALLARNGLRPGVKFCGELNGGHIVPRLCGEMWLS